jgi:tetratricopeptide (TPR) repeat protein
VTDDGEPSLIRLADQAYWQGDLAQARRHCLTILDHAPADVAALSLMANIAADLREVDDGLRWGARAVAADPDAAAPHYALGRLHDLANRPQESEASYRRVIARDPGYAKAHNNLGRVLTLQGRLEEALACYLRALQLDPDQPEANQNYAAVSNDPAAREIAIRGFLRQISVDPTDARAFLNLANIFAGSGRHSEAFANLGRAIAIDPNNAEAHYSRAMLLLTMGDYAEGWKEYEWRWRVNNRYSAPARRFPDPFWDGRRVAGPVLMHGELPFGESLQFVRYARLAAERSDGVIFECAAPLKSLLRNVSGVRQTVAPGEAVPPFSAHISLFSLPRIFGTTLQNMPWQGPYILPDPAKSAAWRRILDAPPRGRGRYRIGIVWTGNPYNVNNRDRSIPPALLAPLADVPDVALFGLQKDAMAPEFGTPPAALRLTDITSQLLDFSDTAAFVDCLDLVITIDTAMAHLAGAMGKPVWVLLNQVPDWRFHLERSDNPWYPSMRLFRQAREGQWNEVIQRVAAELRRVSGGTNIQSS